MAGLSHDPVLRIAALFLLSGVTAIIYFGVRDLKNVAVRKNKLVVVFYIALNVLLLSFMVYATAVLLSTSGHYPWMDRFVVKTLELAPSEKSLPWIAGTCFAAILLLVGKPVRGNLRNPEWQKDKLCSILMGVLGIAALTALLFANIFFFLMNNEAIRGWAGVTLFFLCSAGFLAIHLWKIAPSPWTRLMETARVAEAAGRHDEAVTNFRQALTIAERFPVNDGRLVETLSALGIALACLDVVPFDEGEAIYLRILSLFPQIPGTLDLAYAVVHLNMGIINQQQKRFDKAEAHYKDALALYAKIEPPEETEAVAAGQLSYLYLVQERYAEAEPLSWLYWETRKKISDNAAAPTLAALLNLTMCTHKLGKHVEAEALCHRLITIERGAYGEAFVQLEPAYDLLADICTALGKPDDAQSAKDKAKVIRDARLAKEPVVEQPCAVEAEAEQQPKDL